MYFSGNNVICSYNNAIIIVDKYITQVNDY